MKRTIKIKVYIFIFFCILISIFDVLAEDRIIDQIVAIVNDQVILSSDVNQVLVALKKEDKNFRIPLKINFLKDKVIHRLIIDSLILQEANKMNISITKEQINTVMQNIAVKNNVSVNDLKNYFLFHHPDSPFAYENYINNIEKLLKLKIVEDYELHKRVNFSENKVNMLFEKFIRNNKKFKKINLSYILLPFLKNNSEYTVKNKRILAQNIINKLKSGDDLKNIYLDCKKNNYNILFKKMFWMSFLDLKKHFSNNLNIFRKGQILGPFLKKQGFYILKVNDINDNKENIITEFSIQQCFIKPSIILSDLESQKKIFQIYTNIKKGFYTFDNAVKNWSHDFYLFNQKSNSRWISKESFDDDFYKLLLSLKKNEVSKPIKTRFGWHLIKLIDKREINKFYFLKKQEAFNILLKNKTISEKHNWIKDLKKNAYIKIIK